MKRLFSGAALCGLLTLASCGARDQVNAVYAAEGTYAAAAHVASQYEAGAFGKPDPAVVVRIKLYDADAYPDLVTLRTAAQAGQPIDGAKLIAMRHAVSAFSTYLAEHAK